MLHLPRSTSYSCLPSGQAPVLQHARRKYWLTAVSSFFSWRFRHSRTLGSPSGGSGGGGLWRDCGGGRRASYKTLGEIIPLRIIGPIAEGPERRDDGQPERQRAACVSIDAEPDTLLLWCCANSSPPALGTYGGYRGSAWRLRNCARGRQARRGAQLRGAVSALQPQKVVTIEGLASAASQRCNPGLLDVP